MSSSAMMSTVALKVSDVLGWNGFSVGVRLVCRTVSGYGAGRKSAILSQDGLKFQTLMIGCAEQSSKKSLGGLVRRTIHGQNGISGGVSGRA